jgi:hypothetical protein
MTERGKKRVRKRMFKIVTQRERMGRREERERGKKRERKIGKEIKR